MEKIIYTLTDEAPLLATQSLLPIFQRICNPAGIEFVVKDISLRARILAAFPDFLTPEQRVPDALSELSQLIQRPEANIIKLPNISASLPQLKATIATLQAQGYHLPDYPETPNTETQKQIKARYDQLKGSAVNPVLREGNSDRRAPKAVKAYAKAHPHPMGKWTPNSKTAIATMSEGDFYHNEQSVTLPHPDTVRIVLENEKGEEQILKAPFPLQAGEIIDATLMQHKALQAFYQKQVAKAKAEDLLFSLHLKATMMKVSDPILFGEAVEAFFAPLWEQHRATFQAIGINARNGLSDVLNKISTLPPAPRQEIEKAFEEAWKKAPDIAMVNSEKGITNLHFPNDVIVDASIPAMIRNGGKMYDRNQALRDTLAVLPDSTYARIYQVVIDFCKAHGAFSPATMGSVANVGLMAQKAEEYGSHDKTFEIKEAGTVKVIGQEGKVYLQHKVAVGDIWRMCQTKDAPIRDWVKLAVERAQLTHTPAIFWLDPERAHDAQLIKKVTAYLKEHNTEHLDLQILSPEEAMQLTLTRTKAGEDTISVTGNVLRDYLTDLFPILELGTSAKVLSIVPLMNGGRLFETGAGGTAPKLVEQYEKEGHFAWDSMGEYLALGASLEHLGHTRHHKDALMLAETLDEAVSKMLENNRSPQPTAGGITTQESHKYFADYWEEAIKRKK